MGIISGRIVRKPAKINGSKKCDRYMPDTSFHLSTSNHPRASLTTRTWELHDQLLLDRFLCTEPLPLELLVPATQLRGPGIVGYGSVTHYSSDSAQNSWHLRWHNVGAEASSRYTDSGSERYRHVDVVTGSACVVRCMCGELASNTYNSFVAHMCLWTAIVTDLPTINTPPVVLNMCVTTSTVFL